MAVIAPARGVRVRRAVVLLVLGLVGAFAPAGRVEAGDPPTALDAKARQQRRSELRSAAGKWITHRVRFPSRCAMCQGGGGVVGRSRGRPVIQTCPRCKGKKVWLSPADYRAAYYELRTEAFRRLPGIQDTLETQYKEASQGRPWPTYIKRYRIREWELIDETHGIVWFLYDSAKSPTATHWIWSTGAKPRGEWCFYDSRSDGPWPSEADSGPPGWGPVPAAESRALRTAVAAARISFGPSEFLAQGDALRVILEPRGTLAGSDSAGDIAAEALRLFAPLFAASKAFSRIETEWRTPWQDVDVVVRLKPSWSAILERSTFETRAWAKLDPAERMALVTWVPWTHAGWRSVGPGVAPPVPPPDPEPDPAGEPDPATPPPEVPDDPQPTPVAPLPPAPPAPPPPVAPPPPAPAPAGPPPGPPPALTAGAIKGAEAGVARMRELLALAHTAHDEGVVAHRGGAHDLWQEKLNEARALLAEIESVWQEVVVAAIPGRDEAQREELANERFGAIWDDVYALKSIVRKTSTGS